MAYPEYILENEELKIVISSLGGTILSFTHKKLNRDIVLGYRTIDEYIGKTEYFGAMVGRVANRIGNSEFTLNGVKYHLEANNNGNNLHSGSDTYAFKKFELISQENNRLLLGLYSKDGESGYPGNLEMVFVYELEGNRFRISFTGESDADTLFNITNHSYFNLDEVKGDVLDHEMLIPAKKFCLNDENGMATDKTLSVKDTSFDFSDYTRIGDNFNKKHFNLAGGGIDHNYIYETMDNKLMVVLRNRDLSLSVYADLPDLQIYTACGFENVMGKDEYHQYAGVAIEPQYCPNAINMEGFIKPILKKGEIQKHTFEYILEQR